MRTRGPVRERGVFWFFRLYFSARFFHAAALPSARATATKRGFQSLLQEKWLAGFPVRNRLRQDLRADYYIARSVIGSEGRLAQLVERLVYTQ